MVSDSGNVEETSEVKSGAGLILTLSFLIYNIY